MAIRIDQFYPKFRARAIYVVLGFEIFIGLIAAATYIVLLAGDIGKPLEHLTISGAVFGFLQLILTPFIVAYVSEPAKLIAEAVVHVSQQDSTVKPPNINLARHERSGLKALVQIIYDLALGTQPTAAPAAAAPYAQTAAVTAMPAELAAQLLELMPCGVAALNSRREVIFANQLAPTLINSDQKRSLELIFDNGDTLENWLTECEASKVRDQKSWSRVANRLPDDPERRQYDVIASYQKASPVADTVLLFIDRTSAYAPAQEDMDFIALAAHELRGPITVIRGYLDILDSELQPLLQPDQKELIDRLNVSANRLSGYVNNILNVSRYDRRHLQLHLHEDRIENIFSSLIDDLAMRARTQNRLLSVDIPPGLPTVAADRASVSEVIANLVDNAIKYSSEGGQIIVRASVKGDFVEVTVQDFGIGIPGAIMGNLFNKFYRSHRSRQSVSGTGLGLYISKAIIESHGGTIWARSTEGRGSTFGFSLPIYSTVADKLLRSNSANEGIIESSNGWIKNHAMYRG